MSTCLYAFMLGFHTHMYYFFFFFNETPPPDIYPLPLHDALPISEQHWYKHLGLGRSLRTAGLPLPCTRATAHHFNQAPHHYAVKAALRRAQVRGLGGPEPLARRSEEHTSELQSQSNLVCRLLLAR